MQSPEELIGYTFKNKNLLKQALTHSSCTADIHKNYERLEFFGDKILGFCIAQMLFEKFIDEPEGNLSMRYTSLVCKEAVSDVVRKLGVDKYVIIANEEIRDSDNVLCDIGEAIIGAICIDSSVESAMKFIQDNWNDMLEKYKKAPKDSKSMLQEVAHDLKFPTPVYSVVEKSGSEHLPVFTIKVTLGDKKQALGKGQNKKNAEQDAATQMLEMLGVHNEFRQ